jgi:DNA-binding MurR/RpiR family transcriptional regulator
MTASDLDATVYAIVRDAAMRGEHLSVSDVQDRTGLARSTVYRVAKRYGYKGWLDFTSSLERYFSKTNQEDAVTQGATAIADAILRNRERPILVDAVGDAEMCAAYLQYRLAEQGFVAFFYTRAIAQAWAQEGDSGLAIVINESGMSLLPTCLDAGEFGFETVAITASHDTPVSKVCEVNVVIKNNKSLLDAYEPNLFTAGTLALIERVLYRISMQK